jgi:hypothetical protein
VLSVLSVKGVAVDTDDEVPEGETSEEESATEEPAAERTAAADEFWQDVRVDVVELALPSGVGYTLRAYRDTDALTPVPGEEPVAEDEPEEEPEELAETSAEDDSDEDESEEDDDSEDDDDSEESEESEDSEEEEAESEEVPVLLSRQGRLLLFRSPEGLAAFVGSDEQHALRGIAEWDRVAADLRPEYVVATDEDHYELDLVVRNLRGGHDAWDPELVVSAGEIARDLGFGLRIEAVRAALSPGSPLDDLDDAMRGVINGGIGGFLAKRRTRKIGAQQAALAWRTIVGKISAAVDWRD